MLIVLQEDAPQRDVKEKMGKARESQIVRRKRMLLPWNLMWRWINVLTVLLLFYWLSLIELSLVHILSDWFEAGKGPNPAVASLDRDMDEYFKSKKETST